MMTRKEYDEIQNRLSKKLISNPTNKEDEYNKGILASKSIIKEIYNKYNREEINNAFNTH